jgi:flagellar basal body-associated protein FliL
MADKKEKKEDQAPEEAAEKKEEGGGGDNAKSGGLGLITWLVIAGISFAGMVGGFALAQLMAAPAEEEVVEEPKENLTKESYNELYTETPQEARSWSYDLEPTVGNLDEAGSMRFLRVSISLEMSPELDAEKSMGYLDEREAVMKDFITTYVAGLSLERVKGSSNLNRIKKELRDGFNELLFPEGKPLVLRVFLREFAIQ